MRTASKLQPAPLIGQIVTIDSVSYRVWDIPYYGTLILESLDGKNYFRLDGQAWKV